MEYQSTMLYSVEQIEELGVPLNRVVDELGIVTAIVDDATLAVQYQEVLTPEPTPVPLL